MRFVSAAITPSWCRKRSRTPPELQGRRRSIRPCPLRDAVMGRSFEIAKRVEIDRRLAQVDDDTGCSAKLALRLALALLLLALAQIIFSRASLRARRGAVGIELLLGDRDHAAVLAHLDHVEALRRILEHPMLAFELGGDALDRALDAERLAAADAVERLLLLKHARGCGGGAEIELRGERDHLLRAGGLAQLALHAGVLGEAQHRPLRVVDERAGRAGRYAGEAERAALDVHVDLAERRACGQRDHVDRRRRGSLQLA